MPTPVAESNTGHKLTSVKIKLSVRAACLSADRTEPQCSVPLQRLDAPTPTLTLGTLRLSHLLVEEDVTQLPKTRLTLGTTTLPLRHAPLS